MHELRITSKQHQTGSNSCFQQQMSAKITCYLEEKNENAEQKIVLVFTVNQLFLYQFLLKKTMNEKAFSVVGYPPTLLFQKNCLEA